jgi:hypothetical protein
MKPITIRNPIILRIFGWKPKNAKGEELKLPSYVTAKPKLWLCLAL